MKYMYFLFLVFIVSGCLLFNNEKLMLKKILKNGDAIELYYSGGGATAPDIIWIKKVSNKNRHTTIIGKIKDFTDSDKVDVKEVDSNHISLKFTTVDFPDHSVIFFVDLNNQIERNATSSFNQPSKKF
ncbi:MAG: hypothetical protein ABJB05_10360 [Parafilimonas sp.]